MSKRKFPRKRNKALVLMVLPALILLGVIGWLIVTLNLKNEKTAKTDYQSSRTGSGGDNVTFIPSVYEEHTEITNK